ncbi:MAG: hypothetical protein AAF821_08170 [Cyanobacteria bacterium P01_D01_bin.156]
MIKTKALRISLLSLCLGTSLLTGLSQLSTSASADTNERFGFIDWLLGRGGTRSSRKPPGAEDPPAGSRGEICMIAPELGPDEQLVWHERPTFISKGRIGGLAIFEFNGERPLWTSPAGEGLNAVRYEGPVLRPGNRYLLKVYSPDFPDSAVYSIDFSVVTMEEQQAVAADLESLELSAITNHQTVEGLIEERVDYFWQQGYEMDAWREVTTLATVSSNISEALEGAYEELCQND